MTMMMKTSSTTQTAQCANTMQVDISRNKIHSKKWGKMATQQQSQMMPRKASKELTNKTQTKISNTGQKQ